MEISLFDYLPSIPVQMIMKLCVAITIIIFTRYLIRAITPIIQELCKKHDFDHHTCYIISKIIRYTMTMFGVTVALQNVGIEVSMFIAAFGITGIVLSYGMKDIVANFIASILIMGYKHIKIDDYIKIKDWEGRVIDINLRYTTLRNNDMTIIVPNITLYTGTVAIINKN